MYTVRSSKSTWVRGDQVAALQTITAGLLHN